MEDVQAAGQVGAAGLACQLPEGSCAQKTLTHHLSDCLGIGPKKKTQTGKFLGLSF